jgi:energy-coupling factor transporter transmembrane protein EcfT
MLFDVASQVREARICRQEPLWRHPIHRIVSYGSAIATLLLERAEDLAAALEARAYDVDAQRDTLPLRPYDTVVLGITLVVTLPLLLLT